MNKINFQPIKIFFTKTWTLQLKKYVSSIPGLVTISKMLYKTTVEDYQYRLYRVLKKDCKIFKEVEV